eukprot:2988855-Amphidinium_carterae.1
MLEQASNLQQYVELGMCVLLGCRWYIIVTEVLYKERLSQYDVTLKSCGKHICPKAAGHLKQAARGVLDRISDFHLRPWTVP